MNSNGGDSDLDPSGFKVLTGKLEFFSIKKLPRNDPKSNGFCQIYPQKFKLLVNILNPGSLLNFMPVVTPA